MASKVALVLGSGPRVGAAVSSRLASDGFKVAIASRKGTGSVNEEGLLSLKADFSIPSTIPSLFDAVEKEFHAAPSVVIYNAASLTPPSDKESALSITEERVTNDLNVNVTSPFIAAQEAVKRWASSAGGPPKVFIYTGNGLNKNVSPVPFMMNLGVGKAASAYWIDVADANYAGKGYRFIYADQRNADGSVAGNDLDGPAHAEFYSQLAASGAKDVPSQATFVKGKGYAKF